MEIQIALNYHNTFYWLLTQAVYSLSICKTHSPVSSRSTHLAHTWWDLTSPHGKSYELSPVRATVNGKQTNYPERDNMRPLTEISPCFCPLPGQISDLGEEKGVQDGTFIPIKENSIVTLPRVLETGCCYGLLGFETSTSTVFPVQIWSCFICDCLGV